MNCISSRSINACAQLRNVCSRSQVLPARPFARFTLARVYSLRDRAPSRRASFCATYRTSTVRNSLKHLSASRLSQLSSCERNMSSNAMATTAEKATTADNNPLLKDSVTPQFDKIQAEHVVPGIKALLAQLNSDLDELEKTVQPTWEALVEPLERLSDRIERTWGAVSHLKAVKDSEPLRTAVNEVQPERVKLSLRLSQSKPLYEAFKGIKEGKLWNQLSEAQQRIVDGELRDFVLGGVALEGTARERFNEIQQELSQLSTKFSNNLLDATKAFKKLLKDPAEVEGLPKSALELAAQQAKTEGEADATAERGPGSSP